ncbi:MAG: lipid-A-disaccharide synthase [Dichotomicrobium sp.]
MKPRSRHIFIVAGEQSGDALGARLMAALNERSEAPLVYSGVGGEEMAEMGLNTLFPLSEVAVMGPLAILRRLPRLVRRVYQTVNAAVAASPDLVIIIDSPEFTHPIARRIRRRCPDVPIIDYVSPSVWAWRPGRARKMRAYVDHVLGLMPFEPETHARLGGPPCSYVGHPLVEHDAWIRALHPGDLAHRLGLDQGRPVLVVLPGSRATEVRRLMAPFGETVARLRDLGLDPQIVIPAVPSVRAQIDAALKDWSVPAHIIEGAEDKYRAFKLANAALAASGTVTLELAFAGTPMVVGYKVDAVAARLRFLLNVPSIVLANLVLQENAFPEFIQEDCNPETLSAALAPLLTDSAERRSQREAVERVRAIMRAPGDKPSERAAQITLRILNGGRAEAARADTLAD